MIRAICCKCGKDLKTMLPDDAEEITCFACCEKLQRTARRQKKMKAK